MSPPTERQKLIDGLRELEKKFSQATQVFLEPRNQDRVDLIRRTIALIIEDGIDRNEPID